MLKVLGFSAYRRCLSIHLTCHVVLIQQPDWVVEIDYCLN